MTKVLYIGDVHATVDTFDDCRKLRRLIEEVHEKEQPNRTVWLGDQYDNFGLVSTVVQSFWMETLQKGDVALIGNHDRPGDRAERSHALMAHIAAGVEVPETPTWDSPDVPLLYVSFMFDGKEFEEVVKEEVRRCAPAGAVLVCHQPFIGGSYESGLTISREMDKAAVDPAALPSVIKSIVSGHIHTPMQFDRVCYPGAPRWRNNVSDANIDRFLLVAEYNSEGDLLAVRKYPTGDVCKRTWRLDVTPGSTWERPGKEGDLYIMDITGPEAFINEQRALLATSGVRIRSHQTDKPGPKLSEMDGVPAAWKKWTDSYVPRFGTSPTDLVSLARERVKL